MPSQYWSLRIGANLHTVKFEVLQQNTEDGEGVLPDMQCRHGVIKASKGTRKPLFSHAWRDRFQVDLIDMGKFPAQPNIIYGVIQRWIMIVKDHSTGLTAVFSLPWKK